MADEKKGLIGRDTFRLNGAPITGVLVVTLFTLGVILLPTDWLGDLMTDDPVAAPLIGGLLLRLIGFAALLWLRLDLGFVPQKPHLVDLLWVAPFLITAVNNLPILAIAFGNAAVNQPAWVVTVYALWCVSVALIEETAFRGLVFPFLLRKFDGKKGRALWGVLIGAAIFGGIHIVNLLSGAVLPVLAQIGYSFLIGCVCAVSVLRTRGLSFAVLFHAAYNFCGLLIPTVGEGALWDTPTIVLTAVLGVAMAGYVAFVLWKTPQENIEAVANGILPRTEKPVV